MPFSKNNFLQLKFGLFLDNTTVVKTIQLEENAPFGGIIYKRWLIVCAASLWSLWLARNETVFNSKVWDGLQMFFLIKLRSMSWIRASEGVDAIDNMGWWTDPHLSSRRKAPYHHHVGTSWSPPPTGEFKFNIDSSAKGKPGPAGCDGVLRDSDGHVVGLFFCLIGFHDSNFAELMANLKALKLFTATPYTSSPLIIESDSRVALSWVNSVEKRLWDKWSIFNELDSLCVTLDTVSFKHIFREGNGFADSLAKYGVNNNTSFSAWW
ncbi:Uncharacterized protein TCM_031941 [Theobroma cacao]|uniref:RNase H type-1 domain-containing protein n=1 Tax=Theobroma cacao TaxID=3641 RepID=A0A061F7P3_THECC|nr:Uncharacterized protein TCM_031941 [Theobroma cacao]